MEVFHVNNIVIYEKGFAKAETICVENGGNLVSIHDAFLNEFLRGTFFQIIWF